jgi:hypothetical protein
MLLDLEGLESLRLTSSLQNPSAIMHCEIGHVNGPLRSIYTLVWFCIKPAGLLKKHKIILFSKLPLLNAKSDAENGRENSP